MDGERVETEMVACGRVALLVEDDGLDREACGCHRGQVLPVRRVEDEHSAGAEHSLELAESAFRIGNRVEHVRAEHRVERGCGELELLHVHLPIGERMVEVDREPGTGTRAESFDHATLRPDVQDVGSCDEIGVPVEEEAQLAVTLVRTTAGAIERGIGEKAPKPATAARASDAIPTQRDGDDGENSSSRERAQPPRHDPQCCDARTVEKHPGTIVATVTAGTLRPMLRMLLPTLTVLSDGCRGEPGRARGDDAR